LARIASRRHWWFRFVREPLVLGMRGLAWWHGIDALRYRIRHSMCVGCIRFMKSELEEKSPTFRLLNALVGKRFTSLRDRRLSESELAEAKRFAREVMPEPDAAGR
jgi:hypothetical protein